jgi:hypothetical protein
MEAGNCSAAAGRVVAGAPLPPYCGVAKAVRIGCISAAAGRTEFGICSFAPTGPRGAGFMDGAACIGVTAGRGAARSPGERIELGNCSAAATCLGCSPKFPGEPAA